MTMAIFQFPKLKVAGPIPVFRSILEVYFKKWKVF